MYEVELRSFITKEKYDELFAFFQKQAQFISEDEQTTYYYSAPVDLRLQQNKSHCKLIVKKGCIHDEVKEEFEVPFARDDFKRLQELLSALGYKINIQWLRKRFSFKWGDVLATLDDTKGYGLVLELEKQCGLAEKDSVLELLREKLVLLGVTLTPKREFDEKFAEYEKNWRTLLNLSIS